MAFHQGAKGDDGPAGPPLKDTSRRLWGQHGQNAAELHSVQAAGHQDAKGVEGPAAPPFSLTEGGAAGTECF